jgi:hypothetical protein
VWVIVFTRVLYRAISKSPRGKYQREKYSVPHKLLVVNYSYQIFSAILPLVKTVIWNILSPFCLRTVLLQKIIAWCRRNRVTRITFQVSISLASLMVASYCSNFNRIPNSGLQHSWTHHLLYRPTAHGIFLGDELGNNDWNCEKIERKVHVIITEQTCFWWWQSSGI